MAGAPKSKLKHRVVVALLTALPYLLKPLPRRWRLRGGAGLGKLIAMLSTREMGKIRNNLKLAYPEKNDAELKRLSISCMTHFTKVATDILTVTPQGLKGIVDDQCTDKIKALLNEGQGAILVTPHLGNWEFSAAYVTLMNIPLSVIARKVRSPILNQLLQKKRSALKLNVLYQEESVRTFIRTLKEGSCLGILPDQHIDRMEGVTVDFFNRPTHTPIGPVIMASMAKVPIIPVFFILEGDRYRFVAEEPIHVETKVRKAGKIDYYTQQWSTVIERYIRAYPEQWVWMHNRWKDTPNTTSHD